VVNQNHRLSLAYLNHNGLQKELDGESCLVPVTYLI